LSILSSPKRRVNAISTLICGLLFVLTISSFASEGAKVPAKIRAMKFDSVYVLSSDYPKSPLIIGYRRVVLPYTNHPTAPPGMYAPETGVFFEESLYDTTGRQVLPYVSYSHSIRSKPSTERSILIWTPGFFNDNVGVFGGYDYSSAEEAFVVDIKTGVVLDSGSITEVGDSYLLIRRKWNEKLSNIKTNVFDLLAGRPLFSWADPFTYSLKTIWYRNGVLRLIVLDRNSKYRLLDTRKQPIVDYSFGSLGPNDRIFTNGESQVKSRIRMYDRGIPHYLDPETGRFGPEGVLDFENARWWYCEGYESNCIFKMRLEGVQCMHPLSKVRQVLVRLELKDNATDRVAYKRDHWLTVNLKPGDVGSTNEFLLDEQVWFNGGISWSAEILDYR
jgi:hypothetical protein